MSRYNRRTSRIRTSSSSSEDTCWERELEEHHEWEWERLQAGDEPAPNADTSADGSEHKHHGIHGWHPHWHKQTNAYYGKKGTPLRYSSEARSDYAALNKKMAADKKEPAAQPQEKPEQKPEKQEKPQKPRKPSKDPEQGSEMGVLKTHPFKHVMIYVILGYISGILLVLLWYLLFGKKVRSDLTLRWLLIVLLVVVILLVCYNHTTRCIGVLLLPVLGGYRGRLLLISWAYYLALAGPMLNIIHNIEIMIHSLACGQGLLHSALMPMHQIMGEPVYVVEQSVYTCLSQVRRLMERLEDVLQRLETPIVGLYTSYSRCGEWLRHQQDFFDNQMGTPYDRCLGAGNISVQECLIKFSGEKSMCDMEQRFAWFCSNLKDLASFFDPYMQQHHELSEQMFTRPLESFDKIRSIFAVSITFDHVQKAAENAGPSSSDIELELGKEFDWGMEVFMLSFVSLALIMVTVIVLVLLAAIYFRINFLASENFLNVYLTSQFFVYNEEMNKNLGYSAMPMRSHERNKYVTLTTLRHLDFELAITKDSWMFMIIISLHLFVICFVDFSLFWMLAIMSYHSHQTADLQPSQYTRIQVDGGGMIGFMLRGLVQAFEPLSKSLFVDVQHCLPLPGPPQYMRYWEIGMLCLLSWLMLIFDGYSLRTCHFVMGSFYPENSNKRAQYLLQRLMRDREIFVLTARRAARAINTYTDDKCTSQKAGVFQGVLYIISCGYFGVSRNEYCIICHGKLVKNDTVRCDTPKCKGIFCQTCFIESNCHCIICNPPTVYGDYTNYSEVEDSSEDPESKPYRQQNIYCGQTHSERDKSA